MTDELAQVSQRVEIVDALFNTAEILWNSARVKYPDMLPWGPHEACVELYGMLDNYAHTKQWTPVPVGSPAAQDKGLQQLLCEIASTLLPMRKGVPTGNELVRRVQAGWGSGRIQPQVTDREVEAATDFGYSAVYAKDDFVNEGFGTLLHWCAVSGAEREQWREWARTVITLAKVHQVDALRIAVAEYQIPPIFAGAIVADVCFGGSRRVL